MLTRRKHSEQPLGDVPVTEPEHSSSSQMALIVLGKTCFS